MSKYYKHPMYGNVYGLTIATPIGRVAWPSLITAKEPPAPQPGQTPGQPRFELTLLLDKADPAVNEFLAKIKIMTDEMLALFNEKRPAPLGSARLVHDGDTFDMEKYPYYKSMFILVARNSKETKCYDRAKKEIGRDLIKGGMKVLLAVTPLVTAHGVSYKLEVTQLVEDDGTRFGGGVRDHTSLLLALDEPEAQTPDGERQDPAAVLPDATNVVDLAEAQRAQMVSSIEADRQKGKKAAINLL